MRRVAVGVLASAVALAIVSAGWSRPDASSIPRGFRPETAAAVGARDLWVLGEYRCRGSWCLALVSSTDGGKRFSRVDLPPLPSQGTDPTIVFASARDGFVYVEDGTPLYATHDGGRSWQRTGPPRPVGAFAAGGGRVYAIFGRTHFERASISSDTWEALPFLVKKEFPISLASRGRQVWLLGLARNSRPGRQSLERSNDGGQTFMAGPGPGFGLGCALVPAGREIVWAVCPSGMMAGLSVSKDGGRSFRIRSFHDPGGSGAPSLTNGGQVAAASERIAVLTRGAGGAFLRTADSGRHWSVVPRTAGIQGVFWLAFTTQRVGSALVELHDRTDLWRTTDGGETWHSVPIQ